MRKSQMEYAWRIGSAPVILALLFVLMGPERIALARGSERFSNEAIICSRSVGTWSSFPALGPETCSKGSEKVSEIVRIDADTLEERTLTDGDCRFMPTSSRDGQYIAYVKPTGSDALNIFEMDRDGNEIRQLTFLEQGVANSPAYAPDGQSLLYSADGEVQLLDLVTGDVRTLTKTTVGTRVTIRGGQVIDVPPNSYHASFSPDGSMIVYASTQSGQVQIWAADADGGNPRQLTDGSHGADYPNANVPIFSLGVDKVVFWSGFAANYGEVWIMNPDGSGKERLTETVDSGNSDDPYLSPDGRKVVFARGGPGIDRVGVHLLDVATGETKLLIDGFQWCSWVPRSSPDVPFGTISDSVSDNGGPRNQPPAADAGRNQTIEASSPAGAQVRLNGSGSSDADGDALTFQWFTPFRAIGGETPVVTLPLGTNIVSLRVGDSGGLSDSDTVTVIVQDTTPPTITPPANVTAECEGRSGTAVSLGSPVVSDAVGPVSVDNDAPDLFPMGTTTLVWTATDGAGNQTTVDQQVTVEDTTPPLVTAELVRQYLGDDDDDKGIAYRVVATATDACDPEVSVHADVKFVAVPDGQQIQFDLKGYNEIRALFVEAPQVTLTVRAADSRGNEATATHTVTSRGDAGDKGQDGDVKDVGRD